MIGEAHGSMVVIEQAAERDRDGSILWVLSCTLCDGMIRRRASDIRRGRVTCQGSCRGEIAQMSPIRDLYGRYRRNAAKLGREFELTFKQFHELLLNDCHYCGTPPTTLHKKSGARQGVTYNGIDRADNAVGYVPTNCVTACRFCNMAKGRLGTDEFMAWLNRIRNGSPGATHCAALAEKAGIPVRRWAA